MFLVRFLGGIFIVSLLLLAIFGKRGILDWGKVAKRNEQLLVKIELLEKQKNELNRRINLLNKDTYFQEMTIRKILGYIKNDEIIIEF